MATWQVQEAKARFSELLDRAETEGPQTITKHGSERAVVLSILEYETMKRQKPDLIDLLLNRGPKFDDFEIERDKDAGREIDLE
jgi:antitoxin Phd